MNSRMNLVFGMLLVNFLGIITQTKAHSNLCESVVSKYFECKYLKMKVNTTGHYISDWSAHENYATYWFHTSTLDNITLSRALDLQRDIYLASRCSNTFCRCVRQATPDDQLKDTNYGFAFRDENIYVQLKQAAVDYANEFGVTNETMLMRNNKSLDSIEKFCLSYYILTDDLNAMINLKRSPCLTRKNDEWDYSLQYCLFEDADQLNFRTLTDLYNLEGYRKSKSDELKMVVCILKRLDFDKTCTQTEKRFILTYLSSFHKNLLTGETSLDAFVDSMSRRVAEKKLMTPRNKSGSIDTGYSFKIETFDGSNISEFSGSRNVSLFVSPFFNITAHLEKEEPMYYMSKYTQLKSITISSIFNSSSIPQYTFNRTFHFVSNLKQLSSDNSIMNPIDASEKIWIRWVDYQEKSIWRPRRYLEFFDFRWNVSISFKYGTLDVKMVENVANQAQGGVLVTGYL